MSFSVTISNGLNVPLSVLIDGQTTQIGSNQSIIASGIVVGEQVRILTDRAVVVRRDSNNESDLVQLTGTGNNPTFIIPGPGVYGIFPEGAILPRSAVDVRAIINRILSPDCAYINDWNIGRFDRDWCQNYWGNACEYRKYQEVMGMINALLAGRTGPARRAILNTVVFTFVPNQGRTDVTLLEAAIIMRNVPLVARILSLGANPNLTTARVPLVVQLMGDDFDGNFVEENEEQQIVDLLIRAGAWYPPFWAYNAWNNGNPWFGYGSF